MSLIKEVRSGIRSYMTSVYFLVSVVIIFILGWMQNIETKDVAATNLLVMCFEKSQQPAYTAAFSAFYAIVNFYTQRWAHIVIAAAGALCFCVKFCDERSSGMIRFVITRSSRRRYVMSKLICSFLAAVMSLLFGFALFCISACIALPSIHSYSAENINELMMALTGEEVFGNGADRLILSLLLNRIVFILLDTMTVAFWSFAAMLIAAVKPNKYLAVTTPLMICYLWQKVLLEDVSYDNVLNRILPPDAMTAGAQTFFNGLGFSSAVALILAILLTLLKLGVLAAGFSSVMKRRLDAGV